MPKAIESAVRAIVEPFVIDEGCILVDVEYKREPEGMVLTVFIDREGGVSIDDCERVSVAIDPVLDEKDPIEGSYYLSVSSPGLDRPLKTRSDFERFLGKKVIVKLYRSVNKKKEFSGTLISCSDDEVVIDSAPAERAFARRDIAWVKPFIEF